MKSKNEKKVIDEGTYSIEIGTKKKKGLSKIQIDNAFNGKTGFLKFIGKNRRQRRVM